MKAQIYRIVIVCSLLVFISACGQSGRLFLPDKATEKSQANIGKYEE